MKDESGLTHTVLVNHKGDTIFLADRPIYPMAMRHPSGKVSRVLVQVIDPQTDPHLGRKEKYAERYTGLGTVIIRRLNNIFIPQIPS
jgi:hypothetical protein